MIDFIPIKGADPRHHIIILVHWTGIFLFAFSVFKINHL
nr:MAG TPA: hypothetical protein [Caudoviricetes sp.]